LIQQFIIPYFNFVFLPSALAYETVNPALLVHLNCHIFIFVCARIK